MTRIAIVGAGNWSREMHLPALQRAREAGGVDYAAVCDLDRPRAESYAAALGAAAFTDLNAMLAEAQPDGVALLASPAATPGLIETCLARRLPFLTEKPPAPDAATHRRLLAQAGSLPHIVAYNRRHAPYMRQALEWMEGAPLQAVFCDFSRHNRTEPDFSATSVHAIDTVQCLAGEDFALARIEVAPAGVAVNCYVGGWTASGVRLDVRVTPCTGSAREHYTLVSQERTVQVAYPQPPVIDWPGYVELHERNGVVARKSVAEFGLAPDDRAGLGGIVRAHGLFVQLLQGRAAAWSTLQTSLSTQVLRDVLVAMSGAGGRQVREVCL